MKRRILVAPLDWGLGHATRCIPIIRYLLDKNIEVVIAADNRPLELLKKEFPSLDFVSFPGYEITYPKNGSMVLRMMLSLPKIVSGIKHEHYLLEHIIREKKIDAVISDNRYGLWSNLVPCIFITHQLNIQAPFGRKPLAMVNRNYIKKYKECWIPDYEGLDNLSGKLSHGFSLPGNAFFIGPLSRFQKTTVLEKPEYDVLVLLSGPEPQRSIFEEKISSQINSTNLKILIVQGITEKNESVQHSETVEQVSHLNAEELRSAIEKSKLIISRPGYSTLMDLAVLEKKAVFVPTPGQTEQEYLGKVFMEKGIAYSMPQSKFNLKEALAKAEKYSGFKKNINKSLFTARVDAFIERLMLSSK